MMDLRELYQQVILDHGRNPRCHGALESPTIIRVGNNPLCGDRLVLYVKHNGHVIQDVSFDGHGCAISVASASMMAEAILGKPIVEALQLFKAFHQMITEGMVDEELLGKLTILKGVCEYPMRVKCATLAWHTLDVALEGSDHDGDEVSTE